MRLILMGDIVSAITSHIVESLPYVEKDVVLGRVKEVIPERGLVFEATKEELKNNTELGKLMYKECLIREKKDGRSE